MSCSRRIAALRGASAFGAFLAALLALLVLPEGTLAQEHFDDCASRTMTNATVVLPTGSVFVNGRAIDDGDEVAVFTSGGSCAGAIVWSGGPISLPVWGSDLLSTDRGVVGLHPKDPLLFRVWDASAGLEYGGDGAFTLDLTTDLSLFMKRPRYAPDGLYRVRSLKVYLRTSASNP